MKPDGAFETLLTRKGISNRHVCPDGSELNTKCSAADWLELCSMELGCDAGQYSEVPKPTPPEKKSSSNCGCETAGSPGGGALGAFVALAALTLISRRTGRHAR